MPDEAMTDAQPGAPDVKSEGEDEPLSESDAEPEGQPKEEKASRKEEDAEEELNKAQRAPARFDRPCANFCI